MTEDESFVDYLFPLLRFHSRITDLTADDFRYMFDAPTVSQSGYLMQTGIDPMTQLPRPPRILDETLPETAMEYLEKMRVLCEENGVELILMKAPTNSWAYWWYDGWEAQIVEYAEEKDVSYYNFIPLCEEIGIDWTTDTYDAGVHLNVYGAEKLSEYFGDILAEKHGIFDRRSEAEQVSRWETRVNSYYEQKKEKERAEQ